MDTVLRSLQGVCYWAQHVLQAHAGYAKLISTSTFGEAPKYGQWEKISGSLNTKTYIWKEKMKKISLGLLTWGVLFLNGCTGNLKLVEDGKVHSGTYDQVSKTLQIAIDGVPYKGTFVQGAAAGFGTHFSGTRVTTGSMVMTDGSGQALLTSPSGKVLRCAFGSVVAWRGQGQCQNNEGKIYDLLIGQ